MATISSELKASARSAYRSLYRASTATFSGDEPILREFRLRMRADMPRSSQSTAEDVENYISTSRDVANVLLRNVVQARNIEGDRWSLRITPDTELGSNDSIKRKTPFANSSKTAGCKSVSGSEQPSSRRLNFSVLKRSRESREVPVIDENDLEESFVRGSGPGGQSINKTENKVQLRHKPTGIRVSCQETRSLEQNRKIARRRLRDLLDEIENPGMSREEYLKARKRERERRKKKKAKKKAQKKEQDELAGFAD